MCTAENQTHNCGHKAKPYKVVIAQCDAVKGTLVAKCRDVCGTTHSCGQTVPIDIKLPKCCKLGCCENLIRSYWRDYQAQESPRGPSLREGRSGDRAVKKPHEEYNYHKETCKYFGLQKLQTYFPLKNQPIKLEYKSPAGIFGNGIFGS